MQLSIDNEQEYMSQTQNALKFMDYIHSRIFAKKLQEKSITSSFCDLCHIFHHLTIEEHKDYRELFEQFGYKKASY